VAIAQVLAMTLPAAAGERFILIKESLWLKDIALSLRQAGYDVPIRMLPNLLVRIVALFDKTVGLVVSSLDQPFLASSEKARNLLGWQPRSIEETLRDTAESIRRLARE
jgi:nucleoside-diphosphate-sugar epimerase